jgi:hypothetical protein
MKPNKEIRQIRDRFERIVEAIGAQILRYREDDVHCSVFLGGEDIHITFCPDPSSLEAIKEKLSNARYPAWRKIEIWTPRTDLGFYRRIRYTEKTWHQMFPVPLSLEPPKKHMGNKPQNGQSRVYFILNQEKALVKIGVSANAKRRLFELKSHNSDRLELLKTIDSEDAEKLESNLHKKFKHIHAYGEWFSYNDDLKSFIEEAK